MAGKTGEMTASETKEEPGKNKSCINRETPAEQGKNPAKRNKGSAGGLDFFVRLCYDYGK